MIYFILGLGIINERGKVSSCSSCANNNNNTRQLATGGLLSSPSQRRKRRPKQYLQIDKNTIKQTFDERDNDTTGARI